MAAGDKDSLGSVEGESFACFEAIFRIDVE
jgi:hypothetical protein